jgi:transcription elongation GreA/GreB family factor
MQKRIKVTSAGLVMLRGRKTELQARLKKVQGQKGEAAEVGGNQWHDNFSFEDLCRQETTINQQLTEINTLLDSTDVVSNPKDENVLEIGHVVSFEYEDGTTKVIEVCGFGETDLKTTPPKVEYCAPLLSVFMGCAIGTTENVRAGKRYMQATLTAICKKEV